MVVGVSIDLEISRDELLEQPDNNRQSAELSVKTWCVTGLGAFSWAGMLPAFRLNRVRFTVNAVLRRPF
jgi:hypothetical protein